jgi:redox-sensitive bicupin YhaK (pirin superfamily)
MGFGVLRVINEDIVAGGKGFDTHPHRDMEIITYIIEGQLEHKDSMGNTTIINPGEVQYMCAGTGIRHSEYNPQSDVPVHLLQIWILPDQTGYTPSYDQKNFNGEFILAVSNDGRNGSIKIHQNVNLFAIKSNVAGDKKYQVTNTQQWIQVISGSVKINDTVLQPGDGAGIINESELNLSWQRNSEFLLFDMK